MWYLYRVLIATLRDQGTYPCVHCLVTFPDIPNLGTPGDLAIRTEAIRKDTAERQRRVEEARKFIYEDGYVVNSTHVENILKPTSAVPTVVSLLCYQKQCH